MRIIARTQLPNRWQEDDDGCLIWTGHTNSRNGYGQVNLNIDGKWKTWNVHRRVFFEHHGWLPRVVMHTCDKPACGRIDHLVAGTQPANMADKVAKGRQARGEYTGHAKLTAQAVREIRAAISEPRKALAQRYGVSVSQISRVRLRVDWRHV